MSALAGFVCKLCEKPSVRTGNYQSFCGPCSEIRHQEAQRRYYEKNGAVYDPVRSLAYRQRARDRWRSRAVETSKELATPIGASMPEVDPHWLVRVAVPYSKFGSKNAKFGTMFRSHVYIKQEHQAWLLNLEAAVRKAMVGRKVKQNKVWLDIFVQKESHKSDAVNFVDAICDAVKKGIDLDDRWFSIRRLDWEIVKHDPKIYVGISQEDVPDVQACSYCGAMLTFDQFGRKKDAANGIGRICKPCKSVDGHRRRQEAASV